MLNGTPRKTSAERWYSWQLSLPSATKNWNRQWQGGSAMSSTSAGFQAETMWRRLVGLGFRASTPAWIWAVTPPARPRPGAPLLTVDRAELARLVGPLVPDRDPALLQPAHIGVATQEPQ